MNWYCIYTKPQKEHQVLGYFHARLGLQTYFPLLKRKKTIRRVLRTVVSPLFPRYLFCQLDLAAQYRAARFAPDVIDVVSFGGEPAVVGNNLIEELKGWAGDVIELGSAQHDLQTGEQVEITDGPMRGLSAIVLHHRSDQDRVALLLTTLEYSARLVLSRSQVASAEQRTSYFSSFSLLSPALAS